MTMATPIIGILLAVVSIGAAVMLWCCSYAPP